LTHGTFLLAHGRSLDVLTQAETIEPFGSLRADLDRMSRALYACELLDKFTEPRAENFRLYRLLLDTLRRIATLDDVDLPVRFFEMLLLDELGYRPELDACVVCRANVEPDAIYWSPGAGGVICANCRAAANAQRKLSANALKMLRLFRHAPYNNVARVRIDADLASELERVMVDYVRWVLERDVRTASFIQLVRKTSRVGQPVAPDARPS
jgi:DNA repair protein RecO (recombination protein O)